MLNENGLWVSLVYDKLNNTLQKESATIHLSFCHLKVRKGTLSPPAQISG